MLEKLFHTLSFKAFRWDPLDEATPLHLRFMNRKIGVCSIGMKHIILGTAHFSAGGKISPFTLRLDDIQEIDINGPVAEVARVAIQNYCQPRKLTHIAALCSGEWSCSRKENHTYNRSDYEKFWALRTAPTEVIGDRADANSLYNLVTNPLYSTSMVFSFSAALWTQNEELFAQTGVTLVRLQSGCATLLDYLVHYEQQRLTNISSILLIDRHAFLYIETEPGGQWTDKVSFRTDGTLMGVTLFNSLVNIADRMRKPFSEVLGPRPLIVDCSEFGFENWARTQGAQYFSAGIPTVFSERKYLELTALCHG